MDKSAETKPSQHTKKYKKMFGENADTSLKKKAEKTGMHFGILKQVYNRGARHLEIRSHKELHLNNGDMQK